MSYLYLDQESALYSSLSEVFPDCRISFCTRHLQKGVKDHLMMATYHSKKSANRILRKIFGKKKGLIKYKHADFLIKKTQFMDKYGHHFKGKYLEDLMTKIETNILIPSWESAKVNPWWTTNDEESFNNLFKILTERKMMSVDDLVDEFGKTFDYQGWLTA